MDFKNRKHPRLKNYDYSQAGYYYVTIHTEPAMPPLSKVGRGLAPAETVVALTALGHIAEQQLFALEQRFGFVTVNKYIIMPNHIHVIFCFSAATEAEMRPSLMDVVGVFKSLTTRTCNSLSGTPGRKLFQTSFYESVLRNERAYQECWRYIDENPAKWLLEPEDL